MNTPITLTSYVLENKDWFIRAAIIFFLTVGVLNNHNRYVKLKNRADAQTNQILVLSNRLDKLVKSGAEMLCDGCVGEEGE